jgi:hypothetical protein
VIISFLSFISNSFVLVLCNDDDFFARVVWVFCLMFSDESIEVGTGSPMMM